jgi:hypothetical protein
MNNSYSAFSHQQLFAPAHNNANNMLDATAEGLDMGMDFTMPDDQDFDSMAAQDDKTYRRKSMPNYSNLPMDMENFDARRQSMLDFAASGLNTGVDAFHFNPQSGPALGGGLTAADNAFPHTTADFQDERVAVADLSISTQFANQNHHFSMQTPASAYTSPMHPNVSVGLQMNASYPGPHSMPLDLDDSTLAMMGTDMDLFTGSQFAGPMVSSPMGQEFMVPMPAPHNDTSAADLRPLDHYGNVSLTTDSDIPSGMQSGSNSREPHTPQSRPHSEQLPTQSSAHNEISVVQARPQKSPAVHAQHDVPVESFAQMRFPWAGVEPSEGYPSSRNANPHSKTKFKDVYAPSGFDMLGALVCTPTSPPARESCLTLVTRYASSTDPIRRSI